MPSVAPRTGRKVAASAKAVTPPLASASDPGVPASAPVPPASGALLFGRYRLEAQIGQGGMAEVWRAHDEQLDRAVAIKLLHRHLLPDDRSRERFAAEARAVAGLSHPGIVTVHDIVVDDHQAAMVLELVDGEALSDVIARRGRMPEAAAVAITAQVARALEAAHDRGLIHRDVKPANVLLSPDGRARLVDFGIARPVDEHDVGLTLPGTIMGTLRYMAPEQLSDGATDRATDVFGLGSLLYEMIVARPPFPAPTPAALMAQQRQGAPPMLGGSPELAGLARTALQHDPERRPRSAGLMAAMLERWLENRGISSADLPAVTAAAVAGAGLPQAEATQRRWEPVASLAAQGPTQAPEAAPGLLAGSVTRTATSPDRRTVRARSAGAPNPAAVAPPAPPGPMAALAEPAPAPATLAPASVDDAALTVPLRTGLGVPMRLAGRRVPLVTALGLAGLLLAGLLLAGALVGLQAGTSRPGGQAGPSQAIVTPDPVATPRPAATPTPTVTAAPIQPVTPARPGRGKDEKPRKH